MHTRVAIIGSGVSSLTAAYLLQNEYDVYIFEADARIGGHTATIDVQVGGRDYAIDTGFIVFNQVTYPNFNALLDELEIGRQATTMGFSVRNAKHAIEYSSNGANGFFADRANLLSSTHWGFLREIFRFNGLAKQIAESGNIPDATTLGVFLERHRFSERFAECYLIPLAAVIWSKGRASAGDIPLRFFLEFFLNHGLYRYGDNAQWYVVENNSRAYLEPLTQGFSDRIHVNTPVHGIRRQDGQAVLRFADGTEEVYDHVVLGVHSDQALKMIEDPTDAEQSVLEKMEYSSHSVLVHTDEAVLPKQTRAWEAWNIDIAANERAPVFTYNMNRLQGIKADVTFCVSLDADEVVRPETILYQTEYHHPIFTLDTVQAQKEWYSISGKQNLHFAGAYWRNGFHEDGVWSGIRAARAIGADIGSFKDTFTE